MKHHTSSILVTLHIYIFLTHLTGRMEYKQRILLNTSLFFLDYVQILPPMNCRRHSDMQGAPWGLVDVPQHAAILGGGARKDEEFYGTWTYRLGGT